MVSLSLIGHFKAIFIKDSAWLKCVTFESFTFEAGVYVEHFEGSAKFRLKQSKAPITSSHQI